MESFIPIWILGAPFVGLLILAFSFWGPSAADSAYTYRPVGAIS
jgi:hypothetical protein